MSPFLWYLNMSGDIRILEHEWPLSSKAEILVTVVTNWTLLYHTCQKSYNTVNLGVPVKPFYIIHFVCIPLRITVPIWNEGTRSLIWKTKNRKASNLDTNKKESCSGQFRGGRSMHRIPTYPYIYKYIQNVYIYEYTCIYAY